MSESVGETPLGGFLTRFGLDSLTQRVPGIESPLVLYAILVVTFELGVLQGSRIVTGYRFSFVTNPLWLLRPGTLIGAAWATRQLHDRYDRAFQEMSLLERAENAARFDRLVPGSLAWTLVFLGIAFTLVNAVFVITLPELYAAGGLSDVLGFVLVIPFGYVPVMAMFLSTYISIEVLVPRRIARSDIGLYYFDPENLGGMRPIGELVKLAYYLLLVGLVTYAVALYGPYILGGIFSFTAETPPGLAANAAFTAIWGLSIVAMMYGLHTLHRFMHRQKREKLQRLDEKARDLVEDPWDVETYEITDKVADEYDDIQSRIELVSATREYPATFTMWAQFAVGVVLPKAIQFVLAAL